jgi:hypothetical protein
LVCWLSYLCRGAFCLIRKFAWRTVWLLLELSEAEKARRFSNRSMRKLIETHLQ